MIESFSSCCNARIENVDQGVGVCQSCFEWASEVIVDPIQDVFSEIDRQVIPHEPRFEGPPAGHNPKMEVIPSGDV